MSKKILDDVLAEIEADNLPNTAIIRLLTPEEIEQVVGGPEHYQAPGSSHTQTGSAVYWQLPGTTHQQTGRLAIDTPPPEPGID